MAAYSAAGRRDISRRTSRHSPRNLDDFTSHVAAWRRAERTLFNMFVLEKSGREGVRVQNLSTDRYRRNVSRVGGSKSTIEAVDDEKKAIQRLN